MKKYGNLSAKELVYLTHKTNTPWSKTYKGSLILYSTIKGDAIKIIIKMKQ